MNFANVLRMACQNLWQRRLRTSLNLIGIVFGCIVLLMTVAGTRGTRDAIQALFDANEFARQIQIFSHYRRPIDPPESAMVVQGTMSIDRRERLREALANRWRQNHYEKDEQRQEPWLISLERFRQIQQMPHVLEVIPDQSKACRILHGNNDVRTIITPTDCSSRATASRIICGRMLRKTDADSVMIDEFVAYQLGYRDDSDLDKLVGETIDIQTTKSSSASQVFSILTQSFLTSPESVAKLVEFAAAGHQLLKDLDATSLSEPQKKLLRETLSSTFTGSSASPDNTDETTLQAVRKMQVVGILRMGIEQNLEGMLRDGMRAGNPGVFVTPDLAISTLSEDLTFRGFSRAVAVIDSTKHLQSTTELLNENGYGAYSALGFLEHIDRQIEQSRWIMFIIAAVILLTAAIGISNTLVISVLERTPEFGIMKAVGAKDSQLLKLMLCEGLVLGLLGAAMAVSFSIGLSLIGHWILQSYLESQLHSTITSNLFRFSSGPIVFVFGCSSLVCVLASLLPAWRASRLDPVVAMRRT